MTLRTPNPLQPLSLALVLAGLAASGPGWAQSNALTLPPPGYTTPSDGRAASPGGAEPRAAKEQRSAKKPARRKAKETADIGSEATKRQRRDDVDFAPASSRPRKLVPEGFEEDESGGSARPFVSPSGRAGLGVRF